MEAAHLETRYLRDQLELFTTRGGADLNKALQATRQREKECSAKDKMVYGTMSPVSPEAKHDVLTSRYGAYGGGSAGYAAREMREMRVSLKTQHGDIELKKSEAMHQRGINTTSVLDTAVKDVMAASQNIDGSSHVKKKSAMMMAAHRDLQMVQSAILSAPRGSPERRGLCNEASQIEMRIESIAKVEGMGMPTSRQGSEDRDSPKSGTIVPPGLKVPPLDFTSNEKEMNIPSVISSVTEPLSAPSPGAASVSAPPTKPSVTGSAVSRTIDGHRIVQRKSKKTGQVADFYAEGPKKGKPVTPRK